LLNELKKISIKNILKLTARGLGLITLSVILGLGLGMARKHYNLYNDLLARQNIKNSSVLVIVDQITGRGGSGVIVKSNKNGTWVLTNKHVCTANKFENLFIKPRLGITEYSGFGIKRLNDADKTKPLIFPGQVMKVATNYDLCLIYTDVVSLPHVPIANDMPNPKTKLYAYSAPNGALGVFSEGEAGHSEYIDFMLEQYTTVLGSPGSSGSGVFNTDGELVGLVNLINGRGLTLMVPLPHVKHFLGDLIK